jgi:hypothetical protein
VGGQLAAAGPDQGGGRVGGVKTAMAVSARGARPPPPPPTRVRAPFAEGGPPARERREGCVSRGIETSG